MLILRKKCFGANFIKIPEDHTYMQVTYNVQNCELTVIIIGISYQMLLFIYQNILIFSTYSNNI